MTYRVVRDCFHGGHRYREGETAVFPDGIEVPRHFEAVEKPVKPEEKREGDSPEKPVKDDKKK